MTVPAPKMLRISTEGAHDPGELCKYGYDRQAKEREWVLTLKQTNKQSAVKVHTVES